MRFSVAFIKNMIPDSENLREIRKSFFRGETLSEDEVRIVETTTPSHQSISWGEETLTLLSLSGLNHIQYCIESTLEKSIPGDFIETGVWRGGACILAAAMYREAGSDRKVYAADSFEGLPAPDAEAYPEDEGDRHYLDERLKVSLEDVEREFARFDCLTENVVFVKGWFRDTLHTINNDAFSIIRLDGDMYESTMNALEALYPKLSRGGYCIIDDYFHKGCQRAVRDYRKRNHITERLVKINSDPNDEIHYWIRRHGPPWQHTMRILAHLLRLFGIQGLKNGIVLAAKKSSFVRTMYDRLRSLRKKSST
jgi:O-methyltransferase